MQMRWMVPGILVLVLGLTAIGCSGVRNGAPLTTPESVASPDGAAGDPFVGMWDFDFESGQTAPFNLGMLLIDEPCVYVVRMLNPYFFEFIGSDDSPEEDSYLVPLVTKSLLGLARAASLRFDHNTGQIYYSDSPFGSMSTGDYVSFGETRSAELSLDEASRCSSTSIRRVSGISPWTPPSWLREQLDSPPEMADTPRTIPESDVSTSYDEPDPFIGMWDYASDVAPTPSFSIGMLMIDEPCAYIVTGRWDMYRSESRDEWFPLPIPHKYVLALPRTHTRFDRETGEIWYKDRGPMATGDYVSFGGSPSIEASPDEVSRCSSTAKIRSAGISPWTVPDWLRE